MVSLPRVHPEMSRKNACICLLLVLMVTWIDRLATGTFCIAPQATTPCFGGEIYTLAMRDRDKARQTVEAPPLPGLDESPRPIPLAARDVIRVDKIIPRTASAAEICYLLMSLQW